MDTSDIIELAINLQNINISNLGVNELLQTETSIPATPHLELSNDSFKSTLQLPLFQPPSEDPEIDVVACMNPEDEALMRSLGLPTSFATHGRAPHGRAPHGPYTRQSCRSSSKSSSISLSESSTSTSGSSSVPSKGLHEVSDHTSMNTPENKRKLQRELKPVAPLLSQVASFISSKAELPPKAQHLIFVSSDEETAPLTNGIAAMDTTDLTLTKPSVPSAPMTLTLSALDIPSTQPSVNEELSPAPPSSPFDPSPNSTGTPVRASSSSTSTQAAQIADCTSGKRTGRPKAAHMWSEFLLNPPPDIDTPHGEPETGAPDEQSPAHPPRDEDEDEGANANEHEKHENQKPKRKRRGPRGRRRNRRGRHGGDGGEMGEKEQSPLKEYVPEWVAREPDLRRYWRHRYEYFSRFDRGVWLDARALYSVTPEPIARHQAKRCRCDVVLEACAGAGGNAIQFARTCGRVLAIDVDAAQLQLARHNAAVYGVEHRIEFVHGDAYALLPHLRADVLFLAPPWGGPDYIRNEKLSLRDMKLYSFDGACGCSQAGAGAGASNIANSTLVPAEEQRTEAATTSADRNAGGDVASSQCSAFTCRKCGQTHEVSVWQLLERAAAHRRLVCPLGVALFLPRNVDRDELLALAGLFKTLPPVTTPASVPNRLSSAASECSATTSASAAQAAVPDAYTSGRVAIEENMVNDFTKAITAYFGDALIDADDAEPSPPSRRRGRARRSPPARRKRSPPNADATARSHEDSLEDGVKSVSPPPSQNS